MEQWRVSIILLVPFVEQWWVKIGKSSTILIQLSHERIKYKENIKDMKKHVKDKKKNRFVTKKNLVTTVCANISIFAVVVF